MAVLQHVIASCTVCHVTMLCHQDYWHARLLHQIISCVGSSVAFLITALPCPAPHPAQVGDHKQLPATVISQQAAAKGYSRSLFERLQQCGQPCSMLDVQYRWGRGLVAV